MSFKFTSTGVGTVTPPNTTSVPSAEVIDAVAPELTPLDENKPTNTPEGK